LFEAEVSTALQPQDIDELVPYTLNRFLSNCTSDNFKVCFGSACRMYTADLFTNRRDTTTFSIDVVNTLIYSGATGIGHICALIMIVIMIIHVRSKFTAVGRSRNNMHALYSGKVVATNSTVQQVVRRSPPSSTSNFFSHSHLSSSTALWCLWALVHTPTLSPSKMD
jgi:hypothetical protein